MTLNSGKYNWYTGDYDPAMIRRAAPDTLEPAPSWSEGAACAGIDDPEIFFSDKQADINRAMQTCWGCPIQDTCRDRAVEHQEMEGIWGGYTTRERIQILHMKPWRRGRGYWPDWVIQLRGCRTIAGWWKHLDNGEAPCSECAGIASQALARDGVVKRPDEAKERTQLSNRLTTRRKRAKSA